MQMLRHTLIYTDTPPLSECSCLLIQMDKNANEDTQYLW